MRYSSRILHFISPQVRQNFDRLAFFSASSFTNSTLTSDTSEDVASNRRIGFTSLLRHHRGLCRPRIVASIPRNTRSRARAASNSPSVWPLRTKAEAKHHGGLIAFTKLYQPRLPPLNSLHFRAAIERLPDMELYYAQRQLLAASHSQRLVHLRALACGDRPCRTGQLSRLHFQPSDNRLNQRVRGAT